MDNPTIFYYPGGTIFQEIAKKHNWKQQDGSIPHQIWVSPSKVITDGFRYTDSHYDCYFTYLNDDLLPEALKEMIEYCENHRR